MTADFLLKTSLATTPCKQKNLMLQVSVQLVPGLFVFELHLLELCPVSHIFGVIKLPGFTGIVLDLKENKEQRSDWRIATELLVLLFMEST